MRTPFSIKARDHIQTGDGKVHFNRLHFAESAPRYDIATRLLSVGQDAGWKQKLVELLPAVSNPVCVDIACGTGDVTFLLADKYPDGTCIGVDLTQEMVDIANRRNTNSHVRFECGEMSDLPFADNSADILTGSYAIRNAPDLSQALSEIRRVMKPGGTVALLDFSKPDSPIRQKIQFWTLKFWGGLWGLVLHGNPEVHGYISASLQQFPSETELETLFRETGFELVESHRPFGGMMAMHYLKAPLASNAESQPY